MIKSSDMAASTKARILLVEDERDIQELITHRLRRESYDVRTANSGELGMEMIREDPPDVVLLDLMLPGIDGLEVCRRMRSDPQLASVAIVMLTARDEEADIVTGLEFGADDYIAKPFSPRVLLARIRALLRRRAELERGGSGEAESHHVDQAIRLSDIEILPDRFGVNVQGEAIELTSGEFRLLHLMAMRPGRVFSRRQIIETMHGSLVAVTDRSVDVQIVGLRRKLKGAGHRVQTVRGVGYRFVAD